MVAPAIASSIPGGARIVNIIVGASTRTGRVGLIMNKNNALT